MVRYLFWARIHKRPNYFSNYLVKVLGRSQKTKLNNTSKHKVRRAVVRLLLLLLLHFRLIRAGHVAMINLDFWSNVSKQKIILENKVDPTVGCLHIFETNLRQEVNVHSAAQPRKVKNVGTPYANNEICIVVCSSVQKAKKYYFRFYTILLLNKHFFFLAVNRFDQC